MVSRTSKGDFDANVNDGPARKKMQCFDAHHLAVLVSTSRVDFSGFFSSLGLQLYSHIKSRDHIVSRSNTDF